MTEPEKLSVGRIVHVNVSVSLKPNTYERRPAIVTHMRIDGVADLQVFQNGEEYDGNPILKNVTADDGDLGAFHCWHWPRECKR